MNNSTHSTNLENIYVPIIIIFSSIACLCSLGICLRCRQYYGKNN